MSDVNFQIPVNAPGNDSQPQPVYSSFADDEDFAELIEFFVSALPERKESLRENHSNNDTSALQTIAHQLKGSGGGYGFAELSVHAAKLEKACKENNIDEIGDSLDHLLGFMDRISV